MPDEEVDAAAEAGLPLEAPESPTLEILRHSAAHLMAAAVVQLFPGAQYDVGPAIQDGFFYNFRLPGDRHFTEADLTTIEARMRELVAQRIPFEREVLGRDQARALFDRMGQRFKVDIIDRMGDHVDSVGIYRTGGFVDLCRGPHVPDSGWLSVARLLRVAGVYWRGDERNPQLQRVYGTAWFTPEELEAYLERLAEAEKRDHRRLGRELDLFSVSEELGGGWCSGTRAAGWCATSSRTTGARPIARGATTRSSARTSRSAASGRPAATSTSTPTACTPPWWWTSGPSS